MPTTQVTVRFCGGPWDGADLPVEIEQGRLIPPKLWIEQYVDGKGRRRYYRTFRFKRAWKTIVNAPYIRVKNMLLHDEPHEMHIGPYRLLAVQSREGEEEDRLLYKWGTRG